MKPEHRRFSTLTCPMSMSAQAGPRNCVGPECAAWVQRGVDEKKGLTFAQCGAIRLSTTMSAEIERAGTP